MMSDAKRLKQQQQDEPAAAPPPALKLEAVVAVADFGRPLELKPIERHINHNNTSSSSDATAFSQRFHGLWLKRNNQPATGSSRASGAVFPSGKILVTSTLTSTTASPTPTPTSSRGVEQDAKAAAASMLGVVRQVMYPQKSAATIAAFEAAKTLQLVGSFELGFEVQLEHLAIKHKDQVTYEPEVYRNLLWRLESSAWSGKQPQRGGSCCLAIVSAKGRVLVAGARQEADLAEAQKYLLPLLQQFKRSRPAYQVAG